MQQLFLRFRFTAVVAPTEPVNCIYDFDIAVTTPGTKQVMVGDTVFNYGPGESMLTPIPLQIVAHITRPQGRNVPEIDAKAGHSFHRSGRVYDETVAA